MADVPPDRDPNRLREVRPRPERFGVSVPIDYREMSGGPWQTGRTLAISRSGLAFVAEAELDRGARLEIVLRLSPAGGESIVTGTGYVARVIEAGDTCTLAAAIEQWRFGSAAGV